MPSSMSTGTSSLVETITSEATGASLLAPTVTVTVAVPEAWNDEANGALTPILGPLDLPWLVPLVDPEDDELDPVRVRKHHRVFG